jgi:hypothetical protein
MMASRPVRITLLIAVSLLWTAILTWVEPPHRNLLWRAVFQCGHAPLFGVFAWVVLHLAPFERNPGASKLGGRYLSAWITAVSIGAVTELVQLAVGRDAEVVDLVRDSVGGASFLMVSAAVSRPWPFPPRSDRTTNRLLLAGAGISLLLATFVPVFTVGRAYAAREAAFPRLLDVGALSSWRFVAIKKATVRLVTAPVGWPARGRPVVAYVTFRPAEYAGLTIEEPRPDWTGYDRLVVELFSDLDRPVSLVLRVDDARHDGRYEDRFNGTVEVAPGWNRVTVPLSRIRKAPRGRDLDLRDIRRVLLFAVRPEKPFSIYLGDVSLEREFKAMSGERDRASSGGLEGRPGRTR